MKRHMLIMTAFSMVVAACTPEAEDVRDTREAPEVLGTPEVPAPDLHDEGPGEHLLFRPDEIKWEDAPPSLEPGAQVAVLEGDPAEPGIFTMRIRMPDGYSIAPHWHPGVERVTAVSGQFGLGRGEQFDPQAMETLEAGTYTSIPPEMRHYAMADGETVVQLTSVGPWQLNYVNPADDPRSRNLTHRPTASAETGTTRLA